MTTAIIILLIGLVVIYLEFFLPGGVLAVVGGLFVLAAITWYGMGDDVSGVALFLFTLAACVGVIMACYLAVWSLKRSGPKTGFYSTDDQSGYQSSEFDHTVIGKKAKAVSVLKPSGFILVDGKRYQALSQTGYVDEGTEVTVVGGQGAHLLVREML